jgi:hypothetical protein
MCLNNHHLRRWSESLFPEAKTRSFSKKIGLGQIYFLVSDIEVTANDHGLGGSEFLSVVKKGLKEAHLEIEPLLALLAVGKIAVEKMKVF